jgi:nicotinamide-nucleotide amidase
MTVSVPDPLQDLASRTLKPLSMRGLLLLSEAAGASEILEGGFVTYTKTAKSTSPGVSIDLLKAEGTVCPAAIPMAEGALARSSGDIAVAVTGVAGPDIDEDGNPVGRVCYAIARTQDATQSVERQYGHGSREHIQNMAMTDALRSVLRILDAPPRDNERDLSSLALRGIPLR